MNIIKRLILAVGVTSLCMTGLMCATQEDDELHDLQFPDEICLTFKMSQNLERLRKKIKKVSPFDEYVIEHDKEGLFALVQPTYNNPFFLMSSDAKESYRKLSELKSVTDLYCIKKQNLELYEEKFNILKKVAVEKVNQKKDIEKNIFSVKN